MQEKEPLKSRQAIKKGRKKFEITPFHLENY